MDLPNQKPPIPQEAQKQQELWTPCYSPQQLPQIDGPTEQHHPSFFKIKTRLTEQQLNAQIGLLVIKYDHFQEDFIMYLANMLMCQVEFFNIFISDPLHLYISLNVVANQGQPGFQYLQVQANAYTMLKYCREVILKFIQKYISQNAIFNENGPDSQEIIKKFQQQVIKPLNAKHQKLFSTNNGDKW